MHKQRNLNSIHEFKKWLFNNLNDQVSYKKREMKRVFQWKRYLKWTSLTNEEKLAAKRILLVPVIAFPVLLMIRVYTPLILTGLIIWLLYKWFEKKKLLK